MPYQRRKSPVISGILSFIFPGAGQLYNEDFLKGIILIATSIAAIISIVYTGISIGGRVMRGEIYPEAVQIVQIVTACLIQFGIWLYGIIDAVIFAQKTNVSPAPAGPAINGEASAPNSKEGIIGLGIVLVAAGITGILLQLGLRFEDLIRYGGPMAIILVGGYLVLRTTGVFKGGK
ncbi:MAG: hypothetical protein K6U80_15550 [Firmicutes bacterium]|nr:hypothetical protein [Bacillota bacterium]